MRIFSYGLLSFPPDEKLIDFSITGDGRERAPTRNQTINLRIALVLLVLLIALPPPVNAFAPWRTTHFEVFTGVPGISRIADREMELCTSLEQLSSLGINGSCDITHRTRVNTSWRVAQLDPYAISEETPLDAESKRYQAEVQQLAVPENAWRSWVAVFKDASPNIRQGMWQELQEYKAQSHQGLSANEYAEIVQEQAAVKNRPLDAETLLYQAALAKSGKPDSVIQGLTTLFSSSTEEIRKVLWADLEGK